MSDSEFEDPDEMEVGLNVSNPKLCVPCVLLNMFMQVPMGGKNLLGASSVKAPKDEDASDDDIKVAAVLNFTPKPRKTGYI